MSNTEYERFLELKHGREHGTLNATIAQWQSREVKRERHDAIVEQLATWSMLALIAAVLVVSVLGAMGAL
jgi:uncharacterized membrane protein YidH (DUF202 family)